jgi:ParB family chromosome partitioning protein
VTRPKQSIRSVPIDTLTANPGNVRKALGDLTELADSIREHGILQPIVATEHPTMHEKLMILAGHRRHAAARQAGLATVPVVIRHGIEYDDQEQVIVGLVENCQRSDLGPVEKADALNALRRQGVPLKEVARRTGLSVSRVSALLQLQDLTPATREAVRNGQVSVRRATTAVSHARQDNRARNGRAAMGRPVVVEGAWFTRDHPLMALAAAACSHSGRPRVGGIACGQCWEQTIRADERSRP